MNVVMIVPTGLGCEIGGHAGDANPAAKLLASTCEHLIIHPNVVNASDINEMTENMLYVEGSILDKFLQGKIHLKKVSQNRILVVVNELTNDLLNSISAARVTLGAQIEVLVLTEPLIMKATMLDDGRATGEVTGWRELVKQVQPCTFDALAITTPIDVDLEVARTYIKTGGVNPWGGIEALASKLIANALNKPVAHSPVDSEDSNVYQMLKSWEKPVDPRMAAEMVSVSYVHCILKGLHRAPRPTPTRIGDLNINGLSVKDIDVMVSPMGCYGTPHLACFDAGIPIIMVEENKTRVKHTSLEPGTIKVKNYLEAVGVIQAMKAGVTLESIRRPIPDTLILT